MTCSLHLTEPFLKCTVNIAYVCSLGIKPITYQRNPLTEAHKWRKQTMYCMYLCICCFSPLRGVLTTQFSNTCETHAFVSFSIRDKGGGVCNGITGRTGDVTYLLGCMLSASETVNTLLNPGSNLTLLLRSASRPSYKGFVSECSASATVWNIKLEVSSNVTTN